MSNSRPDVGHSPTEPWVTQRTVSLPELGVILGANRRSVYEAADRGEIALVPVGGRKRVSYATVRALLGEPDPHEGLADAQAARITRDVLAGLREELTRGLVVRRLQRDDDVEPSDNPRALEAANRRKGSQALGSPERALRRA